jgi:hypothetical protein
MNDIRIGRFEFRLALPYHNREMPGFQASERWCWFWDGPVNRNGYSRTTIDGRTIVLHRLIYQIVKGPLTKAKVLDHLCRERRCCNPDHLQPVTSKENTRRGNSGPGHNARKATCKRGHKLSGANVRIRKRGKSGKERVCKACRREREAAQKKDLQELSWYHISGTSV